MVFIVSPDGTTRRGDNPLPPFELSARNLAAARNKIEEFYGRGSRSQTQQRDDDTKVLWSTPSRRRHQFNHVCIAAVCLYAVSIAIRMFNGQVDAQVVFAIVATFLLAIGLFGMNQPGSRKRLSLLEISAKGFTYHPEDISLSWSSVVRVCLIDVTEPGYAPEIVVIQHDAADGLCGYVVLDASEMSVSGEELYDAIREPAAKRIILGDVPASAFTRGVLLHPSANRYPYGPRHFTALKLRKALMRH